MAEFQEQSHMKLKSKTNTFIDMEVDYETSPENGKKGVPVPPKNAAPKYVHDPMKYLKLVEIKHKEQELFKIKKASQNGSFETWMRIINLSQNVFEDAGNRMEDIQIKYTTMNRYDEILKNYVNLSLIKKNNLMSACEFAEKCRLDLEKENRVSGNVNPEHILIKYEELNENGGNENIWNI